MTAFPAPSHIKQVIFDLGAVLLHWSPQDIVTSFTQDIALQQRLLAGVFHHPDWQAMDQGLISEAEAIEQFAINSQTDPTLARQLMAHIRDCLTPKTDTVALLTELKAAGYGIFGLSNICDEIYTDMVQRHVFFNQFDDLVVSAQANMIKPDPALFTYSLERFGIEAADTIFIDDSPANIEAAQQLGIHSVLFTDAGSCQQAIREIIAPR